LLPPRSPLASAATGLRIAYLLVTGFLLVRLAWPRMAPEAREQSVQRWCRRVLRALGVDLAAPGGQPPARQPRGVLLVANHISWLDAVAIHALMPCGFLAKDDLRRWPIVGDLIERTGGVFVQRRNPFDLRRALGAIDAALAEGRSICVFPEGTTTDGSAVLPFFTLVFELAAQRAADVVPIGVRYRQAGAPSRIPAWVGDEAFLPSLFRIAAARELTVEVIVGHRLDCAPERHIAAERARSAVAQLLGVPLRQDYGPRSEDALPAPDGPATHIAAAVRAWIAAHRRVDARRVLDRATLRSLGVDSLSILNLVVELEERLGLCVDESKLDVSSQATVLELSAAMANAAR
jgi:1-acyl-sn-glycerol-3-phosphate acyltransferase